MTGRRLPPKADRQDFLHERGWTRVSRHGSESWQHPRYGRSHFFSLAAAYRVEAGIGVWRSPEDVPPAFPSEVVDTRDAAAAFADFGLTGEWDAPNDEEVF